MNRESPGFSRGECQNLQSIIAVGFKVNNQRAVRFRVWANQIVEETMAVERLLTKALDAEEKKEEAKKLV